MPLSDYSIKTDIAAAKKAAREAAEKAGLAWDGKLADTLRLTDGDGLYLECKPNGSAHWYCSYRVERGGKTVRDRAAFGAYPVPTCIDAARAKRDALRKLIADGGDPAKARLEAKARAKIDAVKNAPFHVVAAAWVAHAYPEANFAADTISDVKRCVRYLTDGPGKTGTPALAIGAFPIQSIESAPVLAILDVFGKAGQHATRSRVQTIAQAIFGFAVGRYLDKNPLDHVDWVRQYGKRKGSKPRPAQHTPDGFGAVLRKVAAYAPVKKPISGTAIDPRVVRAYLDLLALTFVRPVELREAKWAEFDLDSDKPLWVVPECRLKQRTERKNSATKSRHGAVDHNVPLAPQAVAILRELRRLTNGPFLFPSVRDADFISADTFIDAMNAAGIDTAIEHCLHGYRASAKTILKKAKEGKHYLFLPEAIEYQLNHINGDEYFRDDLIDERREMLIWWANRIDQMRAGAANVVPFPQKTAA